MKAKQLKKPAGLLLLGAAVYSYGVFTQHYQWPLYGFYADALSAYEAQLQRRDMIKELNVPDFAGTSVEMGPREEIYGDFTLVTTSDTTLRLVDLKGRVRYEWSLPFRKAWPNPPHVTDPLPEQNIHFDAAYLYPTGDVLGVYHGFGDTPYGYGLVKMNMYSEPIWKYAKRVHHHLYIADDEKIYTLIQEYVDAPPEPITDHFKFRYPLLNDSIAILSPDGIELDTIPVLSAFIGTPFEKLLYENYDNESNANDYLHTNSVMPLEERLASQFPMFRPGQLLVSIRNASTIAVIDPATKKVVWAARGPWHMQHDVSFEENGHILIFDNMGYEDRSAKKSRILEINPATLGVERQFTDGSKGETFYTSKRGDVQRLPNGNYLIVSSSDKKLLEVTPENNVVWTYSQPQASFNSAQRVRRNYLSKDFWEIANKR